MKLVGLTGGIGMGKSTASSILADSGVPVIDTDVVAREVVAPGQPALAEVVKAFGSEFVGNDGSLRRDELARRVFANPDARKQLEQILHPRIRQVWMAQVEKWKQENQVVAVVVIPLLFETDAAKQFNATVCVACSAATQMHRLRERGWTAEQINQRIGAQWPIEEKIARSDFVAWNEGPMRVLADQLRRVLSTIEEQTAA